MLPVEPFDGMVYIDFYGIKWVYSANDKRWAHNGKIDKIPVADGVTTGLLSKELKGYIDTVPKKGGGYGIILKPLTNLRSQTNPDGILTGDVILKSNSLEINCINANGTEMTKKSCIMCYQETDTLPPGFDINFSEDFLKSLCVDIPCGIGPKGDIGDEGDPGADGTGDGPQGEQGDPGEDVTVSHTFTGIKIVDIDDFFDMAVVGLELNADEGKLFVTRGKIKLPTDDGTPAEELVVRKIGRRIKLGTCFEYTLETVPCGFDESDTEVGLDPIVLFYPQHFTTDGKLPTYQVVPRHLSDVIATIVKFYSDKLDEISEKYDKEIIDFIVAKDKEAREALDELVGALVECEGMNGIEYCIGVNKNCSSEDFTSEGS